MSAAAVLSIKTGYPAQSPHDVGLPDIDTGIELRHLRYFVAVAETLHFGKAAKLLNISQPPLSRQIRDLEYYVGVPLFDRVARTVTLTESGQAFLKEAHGILNSVTRAVHLANRAAAGEVGQLAIAVTKFFPVPMLNRLLEAFASHEPGVTFALQRVDSIDQGRLIRSGSVDGGLLMLPVQQSEPLIIEPLFRQSAVALIAGDHPVAARHRIALRELSRYPVASVRTAVGTDHNCRISTMCGVPLLPGHTCSSFEELMKVVELGGVAGLAPESAGTLCGPRTRAIPIEDPCADFTFALAYNRDHVTGPLTRFLQEARRINHG